MTTTSREGEGAILPPAGDLVCEGDRVRVLVQGAGTHSILGTVRASSAKELRLEPDGKNEIVLPKSAILAIELEVWDSGTTSWINGHLPLPLREVLAPIGDLLLTGTGAIPRAVSDEQVAEAIRTCERVEESLVETANREALQCLTDGLQSFHRARKLDGYEKIVRAANSAIRSGKSAAALASDDWRPISRAGATLVKLVEQFMRDDLQRFDPRPRLLTGDAPTRVAVNGSGEFDLSLRIHLDPELAPARDVVVMLEDSEGMALLGPPPSTAQIGPGETKMLRVRAVLDHTRASRESALQIRAQLRYRTPGGGSQMTAKQALSFRLVPESQFEVIPNPYVSYAGGSKVADPQMFFGRTDLIASLTSQMATGPLGTGYAIYGQKRSGKSSLLEQLKTHCEKPPVIVASVSFGLLDRRSLTSSLVRSVLDQVRVRVLTEITSSEFAGIMRMWPDDEKIAQRPIECLQAALMAARAAMARVPGWGAVRFVFLLDEFTYLFEVLRSQDYSDAAREDVREFMRQWKALLESRAFSSVIVGQDTMPHFMQRFPNEFSSMSPTRLGYLSFEETKSLADRPIRTTDGQSRYTGYAVESVYEYTAGHPFFTQVLCDRIVSLANEQRKSGITEADVSDAVETLVEGGRRIEAFRFDCLLTADNTGLVALRDGGEVLEEVHDPDAEYPFQVTARVARLSGSSNNYVDMDEVLAADDDYYVVQDLLTREVLEESGGLRVKIPLFAEYLRRAVD
jgi:hypothetical protein